MNAWVHAILSFIVPGLGQAISKKYIRSIIIFVIAILINQINFFFFGNSLIGNVISISYAVGAAYDAYIIATEEKEK